MKLYDWWAVFWACLNTKTPPTRAITYTESFSLLKQIYRYQNKSETGPLCCLYIFLVIKLCAFYSSNCNTSLRVGVNCWIFYLLSNSIFTGVYSYTITLGQVNRKYNLNMCFHFVANHERFIVEVCHCCQWFRSRTLPSGNRWSR